MLLCAALAAFVTVVHTGSDALGFVAGMGAAALLAAIFGVLVIWLNTNQYATGLALSLFGAGFSAFAGIQYVQEKLPARRQFSIPVLGDIPLVGPALFRQHPMVYVAIALVLALVWFLYRSRSGLVLRSVGESPEARMRWATRCAGSGWAPSSPVVRCAASRAPTWSSSTRPCGWKAWRRDAAGSRWR